MDRFAVTTENGVMHLYYPSIDDAKRSWPNARIEPYDDDGYLRCIDLLIDAADDSYIDYRGRTVLRRLFPWGELKLRLTRMSGTKQQRPYCELHVDFIRARIGMGKVLWV